MGIKKKGSRLLFMIGVFIAVLSGVTAQAAAFPSTAFPDSSVSSAPNDSALGADSQSPLDEYYGQQIGASGAQSLPSLLTPDTQANLGQLGVNLQDPDSLTSLSSGNFFHIFTNMLAGCWTAPLSALAAVLGIVLIHTLFSSLSHDPSGGVGQVLRYITVLAAGGIILVPMLAVVRAAVEAVQVSAAFMLVFVPIFAGILISTGRAATGASYQATLFAVSEVISQIASRFLAPFASVYLAFSLTGALVPGFRLQKLGDTARKLAGWALSLLVIVFVGILTIESSIGASADSMTTRATKFFAGSFIPVVGSTLGDAVSTVFGCMSYLSTTVGFYGVLTVLITLLPVILQLLIWMAAMRVGTGLCEMFQIEDLGGLFKSAGGALSLLFAIIISCGVIFIVSTTIVAMAGRTAYS